MLKCGKQARSGEDQPEGLCPIPSGGRARSTGSCGPLALLLKHCCHLTGAVVSYQTVSYLPSLYLHPLAPRMSPAGPWPSTWVTPSLTRFCMEEGGWLSCRCVSLTGTLWRSGVTLLLLFVFLIRKFVSVSRQCQIWRTIFSNSSVLEHLSKKAPFRGGMGIWIKHQAVTSVLNPGMQGGELEQHGGCSIKNLGL